MTVSEKNVVKRWRLMADADLGSSVNPVARDFADFFVSVLENGNSQPHGTARINPIIRGFAFSNPDLEIEVIECLDLNFVSISKEAARELDGYLMDGEWFDRYQYALAL